MPEWPATRSLNPLTDIDLDPRNPRLKLEEEGSPQERLLEIMVERFKIHEIAESILSAGYLPVDPMIGYEDEAGRVVMREGNRRLATIKLLLQPQLAPARHQQRWTALSERLEADDRHEMQRIDVEVFPDRDDPRLRSYIGFRHVRGILQWPALEKASFIAELVDANMGHEEIAGRLGSYPAYVKKHYVAYRLVRQAGEREIPGHENLQLSFGVLLRALQATGIAEFLGVEFPDDPHESREPVPENRIRELGEFVRWTFGTSEAKRLLPDSRRLTDWGQILQSAEALQYLRSTQIPSFDRAWFKCGGQAESLAGALWIASYRLEESVPLVYTHREDADVQQAVRNSALFLAQILQHFPTIQEEYGIGLRHDSASTEGHS